MPLWRLFVPQSHRPGAEAEVDFGEVAVRLAGDQVSCFLFCLRLSFSGKAVHRVSLSGGHEAFFEGHEHAFRLLGGVPAAPTPTASPTPAQTSKPEPEAAAMPGITLDTADAAELLQLLAGWLAADPATLSPSLLAYIGHPAYRLDMLRADLNRFTFLLGGSDGEDLLGQGQP